MRIAHVFAHEATNLGDVYLRRATREAFSTAFPGATFTDVEVRRIFTERDVAMLDEHDLVVVGGGGLLLRDTFPNDVSDWQWGCGVELLRSIRAPIVVYAIGYNRFRGQDDFARPLFDRHMQCLVERSAFFSVRNTGSVAAVRRYLSEDVHDRVRLSHCPSLLFPRVVPERAIGSRRIGLLLAGDRLHLRHPDRDGFASRIRALARGLGRHSELHVIAHQPHDLWFLEHLGDVRHTLVDLVGRSPEEAIACYSSLDVMIGDRGHAQMIPFALGCRIVSLVSHDKLAWFLQDVGLEDHGIEESDSLLADKVLSLVHADSGDTYAERRADALRAISRTAYANLDEIVERVRSGGRKAAPCAA